MNLLDCIKVNFFEFADGQVQQFLKNVATEFNNFLFLLTPEWLEH